MSGLTSRVATALLVIAVVVSVILFAPRVILVVFVALIAGVLAFEIFALIRPEQDNIPKVCIGLTNFCVAVVFSINSYVEQNQLILVFVTVLVWLFLFSTMKMTLGKTVQVSRSIKGNMTLVVCVLSLVAGVYLYDGIGAIALIYVIAIVAVVDTSAYFVGKAIGKHKFAPTLSPKKTWEGTVGGLTSAYLLCAVVSIFNLEIQSVASLWLLTSVVAPLAILGDLFESSLKRSAGVDDSGSLLPGHGGIYDRLDSLLPVLPIVLLFSVLA